MLNFTQKNFIKINLNKKILIKAEVVSMFIGRERELASLKDSMKRWNWYDGDIWPQAHWKIYSYYRIC